MPTVPEIINASVEFNVVNFQEATIRLYSDDALSGTGFERSHVSSAVGQIDDSQSKASSTTPVAYGVMPREEFTLTCGFVQHCAKTNGIRRAMKLNFDGPADFNNTRRIIGEDRSPLLREGN